MGKWKNSTSPFRKSEPFKPTRKYINSAVEDYLNRGGKINKLVLDSGYYQTIQGHYHFSEADEFLCENSILH